VARHQHAGRHPRAPRPRRGRRVPAAHPPARRRDAARAQGQRVHRLRQRRQRPVRVHPAAGRRHPLPARAAALPAQRGQRDRHHLQHAHVAEPRLPLPGQQYLPDQHHQRRDREILRRGRGHREEDHGLRARYKLVQHYF
jgi:hypothetical protein